MKWRLKHMVFFICLILAGSGFFPAGVGGEDEHDDTASSPAFEADAEALLLVDLINAARRNPLGTAEILGMDADRILADFPDFSDLLIHGMPELAFDQRLYRSASSHTADMLANSYYAYESSDGRTPWHRMNDQGYAAVQWDEALGLLFFNNFISPEVAVNRIFANMFRDELDPAGSAMRNILNPDFTDVGASIGGGLYTFNGYTGNVYLAVSDFGRSPEVYELQILNLVNQVRAAPRPVLSQLGIVFNEADFPELAHLFARGGLAPLWLDPALYRSADILVRDMFENNHFHPRTADGRTVFMRARNEGYAAETIAESRMRIVTCDREICPSETVGRFFRQLVARALREDPDQREQHLFSDAAADAGIRIMAGVQPDYGWVCGDNLHIMTADFAVLPEYPDTALMGVIYTDDNGNGIYDIGEEHPGAGITVKQTGPGGKAIGLVADPAGGYAVRLAPARYRVSVDPKVADWVRWIEVDEGRNRWLPIAIPRVEEDLSENAEEME
jgi:uncharacterized protein YkwD